MGKARDIVRLSLLLCLIVSPRNEAAPWREKNPFRVAASLPSKLIDSIMAQGNWNILFQEGPFSEFQRQIAIANHFALRADRKQAEFYFQKAETALDIAYGLMRGRFGWPRSYRELKATELPWGENRDTFQDYILCRLQLYIETGLGGHATGKLNFENLSRMRDESEKQLGTSIERKDGELSSLIRIIQEAVLIRNSRGLQAADKFAAESDKFTSSLKNYWSRRLHLFRIFENLYHGNLGRSLWLTDYLNEKQNDQRDAISLAQIYIRLSAYAKAEIVLKQAVESPDFRQPDTYGDHLQASDILQNLYTWIGRTAEAEATGMATLQMLTGLRESGTVPRDESLALRQAISDQELRQKIYAHTLNKSCPPLTAYSGDPEMPVEWRIKERIFFENCGMAHDSGAWNNLVSVPGINSDALAVAEYHGRAEKTIKGNALLNARPNEPGIRAYLREAVRLERTIRAGDRRKSADNLISYLRAQNRFSSEMLIFEWGFSAPDLTHATTRILPKTLDEKKALALFGELHREYALRMLRGKSLLFFSPEDAVILSGISSRAILGTADTSREVNLPLPGGKSLVFSDGTVTLGFEQATKDGKLSVFPREDAVPFSAPTGKDRILFGSAIWEVTPAPGSRLEYAPLFAYCTNCGSSPGVPARLIMNTRAESLKTDLADNFSLAPDIQKPQECAPPVPIIEDTLYFQPAIEELTYPPCDTRIDKLMLDYDGSEDLKMAAHLIFAMGWRKDLTMIFIPRSVTAQARSAYLFDYFQRVNRRQVKSREAFSEAKTRAEKSFPDDVALRSVRFYESVP